MLLKKGYSSKNTFYSKRYMTSLSNKKEPLRRFYAIGNWKMYKTIPEAESFVDQLADFLAGNENSIYVGIAAPYTVIYDLNMEVQDLELPIFIGAQNMHEAYEGAYTGEIAGSMLVDAGASFVLLGHSERRLFFHETSSVIAAKIKAALSYDLLPILCIGETKEEKEKGETFSILKKQIEEGLQFVPTLKNKEIVLAYEPVWAIGSGKTPLAKEVQEIHIFCREVLRSLYGDESEKVSIIYGGSVNMNNASNFSEQKDIDGLLIGGASLISESFYNILKNCSK